MKIADKSLNAGEVIGTEGDGAIRLDEEPIVGGNGGSDGGVGGFGRGGGSWWWAEVETPKFSARGFAPAGENGFTSWVVDCDRGLVEDDFAVGVTEFANADEGMRKAGHDVANAS